MNQENIDKKTDNSFAEYTAKKVIAKEYVSLVDGIKKGTKESSSLTSELTDIYNDQREAIYETPEKDFSAIGEDDVPEGKIIPLEGGFMVLNNGEDFVLLKRRRALDIDLDDEDTKNNFSEIESVIKKVNKKEDLTEDEEDIFANLKAEGVAESSPFSKDEVLKLFKEEIEKNNCTQDVIDELTKKYIVDNGESPAKPLKLTQKIIKELSIDEVQELDKKIGLNFFQRLYDAGYEKIKAEKMYRGVSRGATVSSVLTAEDIAPLLSTETLSKVEKAKEMFSRIKEELNTFDTDGKISALKELQNFFKKDEKEVKEMDLSSFLEKNEQNSLLSPINMVKLECDKKTPSKYQKFTLDKKALLEEETAEELEIKLSKSISVTFFKATEKFDDIIIYAEFLKNMQEKETEKTQNKKGKTNETKAKSFVSL